MKHKKLNMKKLIYASLVLGLITSCSSGDKKTKLEKLKKQTETAAKHLIEDMVEKNEIRSMDTKKQETI